MTVDEMKKRLATNYPDGTVDVIDLTGTQDHYQVFIKSSAFVGKTRMQQHKEIMGVFDVELKSGEVHALTIKTAIKE